jgi:hypothetical protein
MFTTNQPGLVNAFFLVAIIVLFVWVYSLCKEMHEGMCDDTFKSGYGYGARLEQIAEGGLGTTGETVYGSIGDTMPGRGGLGSDVYSEKSPSVSPFFGAPEAPVFYAAGNEQYIANQQNKRLAGEGGKGSINESPVIDGKYYEFCGKNSADPGCNSYRTRYCAVPGNSTKKLCQTPIQWVEGFHNLDGFEGATDDRRLM